MTRPTENTLGSGGGGRPGGWCRAGTGQGQGRCPGRVREQRRHRQFREPRRCLPFGRPRRRRQFGESRSGHWRVLEEQGWLTKELWADISGTQDMHKSWLGPAETQEMKEGWTGPAETKETMERWTGPAETKEMKEGWTWDLWPSLCQTGERQPSLGLIRERKPSWLRGQGSGARAISRLWSGARANSLFLLILLLWVDVKEIAAVILGLGNGAAGVSGLRTWRDLRVEDERREGGIERWVDRCKSWIRHFGSQVHPSPLGCPPTGTGRHRRIRVVRAIGKACGGYWPGMSWRGPVVFRRGWTRMALNFFNLKVRAV